MKKSILNGTPAMVRAFSAASGDKKHKKGTAMAADADPLLGEKRLLAVSFVKPYFAPDGIVVPGKDISDQTGDAVRASHLANAMNATFVGMGNLSVLRWTSVTAADVMACKTLLELMQLIVDCLK